LPSKILREKKRIEYARANREDDAASLYLVQETTKQTLKESRHSSGGREQRKGGEMKGKP